MTLMLSFLFLILDESQPFKWQTHSTFIIVKDLSRIAMLDVRSSCPAKKMRMKSVRRKLNAIPREFEGKNVLLVDDSIVRGTTSAQIIEMARKLVQRRCTSLLQHHQFAIQMSTESICLQSMSSLQMENQSMKSTQPSVQTNFSINVLMIWKKVTRHKETNIDGFDSSCFNGNYVTGDIDQAYLDRLQAERNDASKQEKLLKMNKELICAMMRLKSLNSCSSMIQSHFIQV